MKKIITTTIAPWLSIKNAAKAVEFYKSAFGCMETYRLEVPDGGGLVVRLSVDGAEFWVSGESDSDETNEIIGGDTVRMILTVDNPDEVFSRALEACASEIFPVSEEHGWRLGRIVDPFGLHWEIGREVDG